jgi:hypothetical protein
MGAGKRAFPDRGAGAKVTGVSEATKASFLGWCNQECAEHIAVCLKDSWLYMVTNCPIAIAIDCIPALNLL